MASLVTGGVTSLPGSVLLKPLATHCRPVALKPLIQKFDPYINIGPFGTLNPQSEHGECYVTEDGAETDLDLGYFGERFLNIFTRRQTM